MEMLNWERETFKLVGVSQPEVKANLSELISSGSCRDMHVILIPEPTNPVDPKAVKVLCQNTHIGYVPKLRCPYCRNTGSKFVAPDKTDAQEITCISCGATVSTSRAQYNEYIAEVIKNPTCTSVITYTVVGNTKKNPSVEVTITWRKPDAPVPDKPAVPRTGEAEPLDG